MAGINVSTIARIAGNIASRVDARTLTDEERREFAVDCVALAVEICHAATIAENDLLVKRMPTAVK